MGIANKVCDFFEFWYYQYILVTALYMLEFWERAVFSILGVLKTRFGRGDVAEYKYTITSQNLAVPLGRDKFISDLGITIDQELKFTNHINDKINKAYGVLGVIKRHFKYITPETLILLYKSMVRTHIEYGHSVWCPYSVTAIESLEKVQKRATKLIHGFAKLSYSERLRKCELPTLKYRRIRGDMIETYKIITGIYDREALPVLKCAGI